MGFCKESFIRHPPASEKSNYLSANISANVKDSFLNATKACIGKSEIHFRKNPVETFDNNSGGFEGHILG
jgi:hypothetical protein